MWMVFMAVIMMILREATIGIDMLWEMEMLEVGFVGCGCGET